MQKQKTQKNSLKIKIHKNKYYENSTKKIIKLKILARKNQDRIKIIII